jgi:hypothetical protein
MDGVVVFVEHIKTLLRGEKDMIVEIACQTCNIITCTDQVGMIAVGAKDINMIAIVTAQASSPGSIPDKSLPVLIDAVDIGHWQLLLGGQFG